MNMTRREAVLRLATLLGASVVGPRLFAANFGNDPATSNVAPPPFSPEEIALLDEIGETIIPATDVPGAKAVGIGAFIAMMIRDCYGPREQTDLRAGLQQIASEYTTRFGGTFLTGTSANRTALLNEFHREPKLHAIRNKITSASASGSEAASPAPETETPYFRILKELTVLGYFSSEIGCTQALHFIEVPGRFDGNVAYTKGEHAWFS